MELILKNRIKEARSEKKLSQAQLAQMVGDGGAAHIHHGGEVNDALLTVAEDPEQLDPAAVTQLTQQLGDLLKIITGRAFFHHLIGGLTVVMGQFIVIHRVSSLGFVFCCTHCNRNAPQWQTNFPGKAEKSLDLLGESVYDSDTKIKQVLNRLFDGRK